MLYLIQTVEDFIIQNNLTEITSRAKSDVDLLYFSALEASFSEITQEMLTDDLFGNEKIIVLQGLEDIKPQEYLEQLDANIGKALGNSENTLIIIFKRDDKLSKTLEKQLKQLLDNGKHIHFSQKNEYQSSQYLMKQLPSKHQLSKRDMSVLLQRYKGNLSFLVQEINQIKLRKSDGELISMADFIDDVTFFEEQVFDLIKLIEEKRVKESFKTLDILLLHQQNVFGLLALLYKNYKEMYQLQSLMQAGYMFGQATKRLGLHEYRAKMLLKSSKNIPLSFYPMILSKLIEADKSLKTGKLENTVLPELFLEIFAEN